MRQDWIEFETKKEAERCERACLRPERILAIQDREKKGTRLTYDCNGETGSVDLIEPYEQVKQKIMSAERGDLSDVVVERFIREEYEFIANAIDSILSGQVEGPGIGKALRIRNKLNEILKEDK